MTNSTLEKSQNRDDVFYGPSWYNIDPKTLSELKTLRGHKPLWAAFWAWVWIAVLVKTYLAFPQLKYFYPLVVLFIAGRAGVFLQLAHEAAHGLISSNQKFNNWFGHWIATGPIGFDLKGYAEGHIGHHACTNQVQCDPASDIEKYKVVDVKSPKLWFSFLKDAVGFTALFVRMMYDKPDINKYKDELNGYANSEENYTFEPDDKSIGSFIHKYIAIGIWQIAIIGLLFNFNILHYILLWAVPLITAHMVLMRVRGIAEHGLGPQLGFTAWERRTRGTFFTRSFGTPAKQYKIPGFNFLERCLIGSLDVYYHHEHHLFPKVPYYNLAKVHKLIAEDVKKNNPYTYVPGYFSCLFFNMRHDRPMPHPKPNFP